MLFLKLIFKNATKLRNMSRCKEVLDHIQLFFGWKHLWIMIYLWAQLEAMEEGKITCCIWNHLNSFRRTIWRHWADSMTFKIESCYIVSCVDPFLTAFFYCHPSDKELQNFLFFHNFFVFYFQIVLDISRSLWQFPWEKTLNLLLARLLWN